MADAPLQLLPVDITPFKNGNTGIDYVHRFDSGRPGPHVLLNALTHGNEVCGAHALKLLLDEEVRPQHGVLTLSFANVAAYHSFDAGNPTASRYLDEDFNRLWTHEVLASPRRSAELDRARELRPVVEEADFLLDLHSMQGESPALMLSGTAEKGRVLAQGVGVPAFIVADAGHRAGARMRDYGDFANPEHARTALLVECGQHWQQVSRAVAIDSALRFLVALDIIAADTAAPFLNDDAPPPQRLIEVTKAVTIETDDFAFEREYTGLEVIAEAGTVLAHDGGRPIVTPYEDCVLVMPSQRLVKGQTAVRLGRLHELA